jgi:putative transposase
MAELIARDLSELAVAVAMIDGVEIAGQCCVVAMVICTDGTKVPVGLWLGDTENKTVVTNLLADLQARGLSAEGGLLAVIDGAKALAAGVRKVFGDQALVQRCTLHKRRNVKDHLPDELGRSVDWRLARAFKKPDPAKGSTLLGGWPASSRLTIPTPLPACCRASRTCSPCPASASPGASPSPSPTPIPSSP